MLALNFARTFIVLAGLAVIAALIATGGQKKPPAAEPVHALSALISMECGQLASVFVTHSNSTAILYTAEDTTVYTANAGKVAPFVSPPTDFDAITADAISAPVRVSVELPCGKS